MYFVHIQGVNYKNINKKTSLDIAVKKRPMVA